MSRKLLVFLQDSCVGELVQRGDSLTFTYAPSYFSTSGSLPLSRHLPIRAASFGHEETHAFFANLLPEGAMRDYLARQLGISGENVYALLEAAGGDCIGAISLRPDGTPGKGGTYRPISEEELALHLDNLPVFPFAGEENVRLSLPGAQNKVPIYFDGTGFFVPEGDCPSSHIIKTPIEKLDDTVVNEAFCMTLAARIGLPVPMARLASIAGRQVYMIERYDRKKIDGAVMRLHQEDFCQALGVPPRLNKYEKEGGPGFQACFRLVEEWSDEPLLDTGNLLNWALFNFLIGNADAHAKNLSFLYAGGTIRLAPFYDLISTAVYPRVNNKFAMKMGGQKDPRYLQQTDLQHFAAETGINVRAVRSAFRELAMACEPLAMAVAEEFRKTAGPAPIIDAILKIIAERTGKVRALAS
ncbi:HipA domain protein [Geotalea daltonii FRC-32]|uniref:HipA domain protein n=1 Tax=Geotalea daltonii (strain DSM 22248 / JCM 15807 / FRC-32) TaxID=316067 RepID=B9M6M1_GEODF|nr:type II toxin-antitoxin system HipA family toxin [Geotalea daltonii]ACM20081.1 HipA domain protein [Geotalea daltonii FRC-32]